MVQSESRFYSKRNSPVQPFGRKNWHFLSKAAFQIHKRDLFLKTRLACIAVSTLPVCLQQGQHGAGHVGGTQGTENLKGAPSRYKQLQVSTTGAQRT